MCTSQNIGPRVRGFHLRLGVVASAVAIGFGFALAKLGLASSLGWLLIVPLAFSLYWLQAGVLGVCAFTGLRGRRVADHGPECVPDLLVRSQLRRRGLWLMLVSVGVATFSAALFVASA